MDPMFSTGGNLFVLLLGLGFIGLTFGLALIRRITRDPEDGPSSWRSKR